ncbi:MAG: hypothetical protein KAJ03_04595 [Gammaproteobacteria bacterium]|nr:hypothetical protein [Gammaproteobacteria bacterium]
MKKNRQRTVHFDEVLDNFISARAEIDELSGSEEICLIVMEAYERSLRHHQIMKKVHDHQ